MTRHNNAPCVFCKKILEGDYEFESAKYNAVAFAPLNPVTSGHMLFVPREHVPNAGIDPITTADVFAFASEYADDQPLDYNLITSAGHNATQTVHHLHVHFVPRSPNDDLHLPWTGQPHDEPNP